jgi:uncharacterized protein YggE
MIQRRVLPFVLLASLVLAACGALPGSQQRSLSVTGTGSVNVVPDVVTVSLGVQTVSSNIAQAVADNNRRAGQVQQAAREAGVADADIQTVYFYVTPQQQYDTSGNPTGIVTYWVDNTINVTLRQTDKLGELLQAAIDAGANSVQSVSFSVDDPSQAEDQARQEAMDDARGRAEMLATAAGATLGEPISISTNVYLPGPTASYRMDTAAGVGGGVPVTVGTTEVQVQVSVVYELR